MSGFSKSFKKSIFLKTGVRDQIRCPISLFFIPAFEFFFVICGHVRTGRLQ